MEDAALTALLASASSAERERGYRAADGVTDAASAAKIVGSLAARLAKPAAETEASEWARVALLISRLIGLDCVTVGREWIRDGLWLAHYTEGCALDVALMKLPAELTKADAMLLAAGEGMLAAWQMKGWTAPLDGSGLAPLEWMVEWVTKHAHLPTTTPDPARSIRLTDILIEILRDTSESALPDDCRAGVWNLMAYQANQRSGTAIHQARSGVLELGVAEMRMAAPSEWMSSDRDPSGRFTAAMFSMFHIVWGVSDLGDTQLEALLQTDGLFEVLLDALKAYEAAPNPSECSGMLLSNTCTIMHLMEFANSQLCAVQMHEASPSIRFLLENELDWLKDSGMSTTMAAVWVAGALFGREENAGTVEITQAHIDQTFRMTATMLDGSFFGGM